MLTTPAFNALLKTLEEPPQHAIFILATTEYEKLPATITSRTQRFLFKKLAKPKILEKLRVIVEREKIAITPDALELVAAAADGSVRDAESLLDQLAAFGGKLDLETAERLTGRIGFRTVDRLAELILRRDLPGALEYLAKVYEEGVNVVQLAKDLIHYLRRILTLRMNPNMEKVLHTDLTTDEVKRVAELAKLAEPESQIRLLRALIRAYTEMRYSPLATVPFEIALVEELQKR
jgi:DNA polymerase-3 subunit gamma/tau